MNKTIICKNCKKDFRKYQSDTDKFCSRKCYEFSKRKNEISYTSLHQFIRRNFGKAKRCERSGCLKKSKQFDWALKRGREYSRDIKDYLQMCRACHLKYDGINKKGSIKKMVPNKMIITNL